MTSTDSGIGIGGLSISRDEISSSLFNPFESVEVNSSFVSSMTVEVRPITNLQVRGPHTFVFPPDPTNWTQPDSLRLSGRMRILKKVNNMNVACVEVDDVSCINNYIHSLFKSVDVKLNGTEIADPNSAPYGYK